MSSEKSPDENADPQLDLRVSHADRDRVAEQLRDAAGDGRLDLEELEERLERALTAKTYRDLEPLTADLPSAGHAVVRRPSTSPESTRIGGTPSQHRSQAILSESKRTGAWVVPASYAATAVLGQVEVDLRDASVEKSEIEIRCSSILGDIKVLVRPDVTVIDQLDTFLGEFRLRDKRRAELPPAGGPVVRISGQAVLGSVTVYRLPAGESRLGLHWRH
ncbi:MAG: DUF1707 domain-containing protein [Propionibacteriales bacterium]|nr:DUF1707 domain-containing protein [Propionibacteriales bacterium]